MEQGKFAYRKNLEAARKALLDRTGTQYQAPDAEEQLDTQQQGLMRPKSRPPIEDAGSLADGLGLALMDSLKAKEEVQSKDEQVGLESSLRPPGYRPPNVDTSGDMSDRDLLAYTLQAEAGGEGFNGALAAGSVIFNRVKSGKYGKGLQGVIMKPGQFSAWNKVTGYAGGEGGLDMNNMRPTKEMYKVADTLISGSYKDKTGGATHYYNPDVATPKWGPKDRNEWITIGNHLFGHADK